MKKDLTRQRIHPSLWLALLNAFLLLVGCKNPGDATTEAAAATTVGPVIASYGVGYGANNLSQSSALTIGGPPAIFSDEISVTRMAELSPGHDVSGMWVEPKWKYMGTKQGYHFFAYYPDLFGYRKIYRVREQELHVESPFELRAIESRWRAWSPPWVPSLLPIEIVQWRLEQKVQPLQVHLLQDPFAASTNGLLLDFPIHLLATPTNNP